jgi:hypothetical protein
VTRVYLEVGKRRVFASAAEWPGWTRAGKDEKSALEALAAAAPRYADAAKAARIPFAPGTTLDVVERLPGDATTEFGAPGAIAKAESKRLTKKEAGRLSALVAVAAYRAQPRLALAALVALLFLLPQALLILVRGADAPVQDSVLLTDAAAGRLLQGIDPYGHDYIDAAALRRFWAPEIPVNPLLAHYPYPPGLILLAAPLHAAGLGAAWLWLPAFAALGLAAYLAAGRAGVVAVTLNPLLLLDYLSLLSDVFFLAAALAARSRAIAAVRAGSIDPAKKISSRPSSRISKTSGGRSIHSRAARLPAAVSL